ncbi:hypothetical protein Mal33_55580 [Rosistilla oblonga]|uniref:Uncharacterized protein n=2 Tax=Rosistilla oblonga TaxID=2527990 RepID=A0A518J2F7_9BACT|nr:hypothetical protein Mal33_55580 [Rosistilla oblonga]
MLRLIAPRPGDGLCIARCTPDESERRSIAVPAIDPAATHGSGFHDLIQKNLSQADTWNMLANRSEIDSLVWGRSNRVCFPVGGPNRLRTMPDRPNMEVDLALTASVRCFGVLLLASNGFRDFAMRRLLKTLGLVLVFIATGLGAFTWWAARAAQQAPAFYKTAVASAPLALQHKEELQAQFEQLSQQVQIVGDWHATFTTDQINAWLASELANQFPNVLPPGTEDPRVSVEDGKVIVAARYRRGRIDSVISFELHAQLTDEPNVIALQIHRLRAGALPIPLQHFSDKISIAASRGDLEVRWENEEDDLIALVTVPSEHDRYVETPVVIETLELLDGEIVLAGRTGAKAHTAWIPDGPIYKLAKASTREISHN